MTTQELLKIIISQLTLNSKPIPKELTKYYQIKCFNSAHCTIHTTKTTQATITIYNTNTVSITKTKPLKFPEGPTPQVPLNDPEFIKKLQKLLNELQ